MSNEKPVIEYYWDRTNKKGGENRGVWRARLQENHKVKGQGASDQEAVNDLLKNAKQTGLSGRADDYQIIQRPDWMYAPPKNS